MKHNSYVLMFGLSGMVAVLALASLFTGCDRASHSSTAVAASRAKVIDDGGLAIAGRSGRTEQASQTPLFHGEPLWAENRHGSAEDNALYQFRTRGADLGAKTLDEYLKKVHAFFRHPPKGSEQVVRASNGDRMIYDKGSNLFGVARKDGAPRVLMHPLTGAAYWRDQKALAGRASNPRFDRASRSGSSDQ
jgi:pyocin large subunit-like protein